jgi:PIN domain nuclease of toxin-antitoxin system
LISLGKLTLTQPFDEWITAALNDMAATVLPISVAHASRQITLPWHHRDPFDRLLVAQALSEDVPLVSKDEQFDTYGVERIW